MGQISNLPASLQSSSDCFGDVYTHTHCPWGPSERTVATAATVASAAYAGIERRRRTAAAAVFLMDSSVRPSGGSRGKIAGNDIELTERGRLQTFHYRNFEGCRRRRPIMAASERMDDTIWDG